MAGIGSGLTVGLAGPAPGSVASPPTIEGKFKDQVLRPDQLVFPLRARYRPLRPRSAGEAVDRSPS